MGRFERHLDQQKVEQVLALNIKPHRHASASVEPQVQQRTARTTMRTGRPLAHVYAHVGKPTANRWPSKAYAEKLALKGTKS